MDTSKEYIKMCDCSEIQSQRLSVFREDVFGNIDYESFEVGDYLYTGGSYLFENDVELIGTTIYKPHHYHHQKEGEYNISLVGFDEGDGYKCSTIIWLPRQDQIQEMIPKCTCVHPLEKLQCVLQRLVEHGGMYGEDTYWSFPTSMEQFWLAFYMYEKYKKIWNGEKWEEAQ